MPFVPAVFAAAPPSGPALFAPPAAPQTLVATHTAITASKLAALTNQTVTFTATVTGSSTGVPGGIVDFYDGATKIGSGTLNSLGQATFSISTLGVGIHKIFATYEGNSTYHGSSSPTSCAVSIRQDFLTSTSLVATSVTTYGQLATLTATVKALNANAGIPAGSVTFTDGQTVLGTAILNASGTAVLTGVKLPVGSNTIIASYQGGGQFDPSSSARCQRDIFRASTALALVTSLPTATVGQSITLTATVTSPASGAEFQPARSISTTA